MADVKKEINAIFIMILLRQLKMIEIANGVSILQIMTLMVFKSKILYMY